MEELSKKIINDHMIRKSKQQKQAFTTLLMEELKEGGHTLRSEKYGDIFKSENIIVGNFYQAKYVLAAHYDTCATMYFIPNFCTPKNKFIYFVYQLCFVCLIVGVSILLALLGTWWTNDWFLKIIFTLIIFYFFLVQMLFGRANKNNYNDNTSGIITLVESLAKLNDEQKKNVCVVFFGNEEKGLIGSRLFLKKHKSDLKDKTLINVDCVSDGDYFLCGHYNIEQSGVDKLQVLFEDSSKKLDISVAKKLMYPSDQKGFPHYLVFTACNKSRVLGFYLSKIHTSRDIIFDEENIEILSNRIIRFTNEEKEEESSE